MTIYQVIALLMPFVTIPIAYGLWWNLRRHKPVSQSKPLHR
jgi:hypothetical protein